MLISAKALSFSTQPTYKDAPKAVITKQILPEMKSYVSKMDLPKMVTSASGPELKIHGILPKMKIASRVTLIEPV